MHEWEELDKRYAAMAKKDPKGANAFKSEMTTRFHKTVASLEDENKEQKKQLEDVHEERVQANLNERKRQVSHSRAIRVEFNLMSSFRQHIIIAVHWPCKSAHRTSTTC
jgi:hypothetical protein